MRYLAIFILIIGSAHGACHAVLPGGAGAKTGADWNNAFDGNSIFVGGNNLVDGDSYYIGTGAYSVAVNLTKATTVSFTNVKVATASDQGQGCAPSIAAGWVACACAVDGVTHQATFNAPFIIGTSHWLIDGTVTATTGIGCSSLGTTTGCGIKVVNTCADQTCSTSKSTLINTNNQSNITVQYVEGVGSGAGTLGVNLMPGEQRGILASPNGASCSSNVVTLTTTNAHRYAVNQWISPTGITLGGFTNGTFQITSIGAGGFPTTLSFAATCNNGATGGGGTIDVNTKNAALPDDGIYSVNGAGGSLVATNNAFYHNYIHHVQGIPVVFTGASGQILDHDWLYITGAGNVSNHLQGVQLSGGTSGTATFTITNNAWQDLDGATSCVAALDDGLHGNVASVTIAGNLCFFTSGNPNKAAGFSNGSFVCFNSIVCNGWKIVNNDIVNILPFWGQTDVQMASPPAVSAIIFSATSTTSWINENNLFCGTSNLANSTGTNQTVDYNYYCNDNSGAGHPAETHGQNASLSIAQTLVAYGSNNFHLLVDTNAYDGTQTSSPDPDGVARTTSRGAFQFKASTGSPGAPSRAIWIAF